MGLRDIMQSDLSLIESDLDSQTMTWKGLDITVIPSSLQSTKTLEEGGFELSADKVFTINLDNFPNGIVPQLKEQVVFRNKTYRIEQINTNPNLAFIRIFLVDVNKGV